MNSGKTNHFGWIFFCLVLEGFVGDVGMDSIIRINPRVAAKAAGECVFGVIT